MRKARAKFICFKGININIGGYSTEFIDLIVDLIEENPGNHFIGLSYLDLILVELFDPLATFVFIKHVVCAIPCHFSLIVVRVLRSNAISPNETIILYRNFVWEWAWICKLLLALL